jgi:hypothetical protein
MPGLMDNVATVNSLIRTLLALVVVGGVGAGGLIAFRSYYEKDRAKIDLEEAKKDLKETEKKLADAKVELIAKDAKISDLNKTVERQATAMRLLKKDTSVAYVRVLDQTEENGTIYTKVRWVEVDEKNRPLGQSREFKLRGKTVHVDAWVVTFDDKYVEAADLLRGTALYAFKRIYGEFPPRPEEVHVLDVPGSLPSAYRKGKEASEFERKIWNDFWAIANDAEKAEALGISGNQGVVVYKQEVVPNKTYKLELRSTGQPKFDPLEKDESDPTRDPAA